MSRKWLQPLCEIGPLLVFFVVNSRFDIYAGTAAFVAATAVALPLNRWVSGRWPIMPLVGGFFVLVFGALTLILHDALFIKLKPTIVNCLFGTILAGGLLAGRSLLQPLFESAFRLDAEGWRRLTLRWCVFFFVLAGVNEVAWRMLSDEMWAASKLFVSLPLTFLFSMAQIPLVRRHWDGDDNPFAPDPKPGE